MSVQVAAGRPGRQLTDVALVIRAPEWGLGNDDADESALSLHRGRTAGNWDKGKACGLKSTYRAREE